MNTRHRPPFTKEQLHAIGQRNNSPEVRELLWAVHRLRAIVLRVDQVQRSLGQMGGGVGLVLGALREELNGEPCIVESPKLDI